MLEYKTSNPTLLALMTQSQINPWNARNSCYLMSESMHIYTLHSSFLPFSHLEKAEA